MTKDLGTSVYNRLKKHSQATGRPFQEVLLYYAMERFLARLSQSKDKENLILKGALLLHVISPGISRATRDIDFLGRFENDIESVADRLRSICAIALEDGVRFDEKSLTAARIKEDADYEGVRITFRGHIATARIPMQLDIGFGDAITPAPEKADYPSLLKEDSFQLKMYPQETVVAEKLEAMVKLDMVNSRMKDFFDLWFLAQGFEFDGCTLQTAIGATFKRRGTELPPIPVGLTNDFWSHPQKITQWRAFLKRLNVAAPTELADAGGAIAEFLLPVVHALTGDTAFKKSWSGKKWV